MISTFLCFGVVGFIGVVWLFFKEFILFRDIFRYVDVFVILRICFKLFRCGDRGAGSERRFWEG